MREKNRGRMSLKTDVVMKDYLRSNEKFADLVNGVCFHGKQVVRPEELVDEDTDQSYLTEPAGTNDQLAGRQTIQTVQKARDSIRAQVRFADEADAEQSKNDASEVNAAHIIRKLARDLGVQLVLWAVEPQMYVHYGMPLQVMGYDYATYRKQYDRNAGKFTKAFTEENHIVGNELFSRMLKTDRFSPVITICLYLGEPEWDGARSLKEMLDIPEEVRNLVNDYPIHLIDARRDAPSLVFHDERNQDLFALLALISDKSVPIAERRKKLKHYSECHRVAPEVTRAVYSITRRKVLPVEMEEEEVSMDELIRYIMDEGVKEGEARGEKRGEKRGKKEGQMDVIRWMMENPDATPEMAMQKFGFSET